MNNIENAIHHLQSSIDIRSNRITKIHNLIVEYVGDYKNALKDGNSSLVKDYKHEINLWKAEIVKEVKQQKTEKKMLAMMICLQGKLKPYDDWQFDDVYSTAVALDML